MRGHSDPTSPALWLAATLLLTGAWLVAAPCRSAAAQDDERPIVGVITPSRGPASRELTLPGDVDAWYEAPIYAQVAGYIAEWTRDYGAAVKRGEVLATIRTPALDQQFAIAQASLAEAQTRLQLADLTSHRWQSLSGTEAVAQQEVDVQVADAAAQAAEVEAARYQVERYRAQEGFKRIVAPFDGVVTSRRTDVGDFVNPAGADSGAPTGSGALFTVAAIDRLRVFVSVPEQYAGALKPGLTAQLSLSQFPGRTIEAVFRTCALSFNEQSRSVLTELTVDNPSHAIWPGTFAEVHFVMPSNPGVLIVPEEALITRGRGIQVALVQDGRIHLQDVTLGLNFGQTVQVMSGLGPDDRLVSNPSAGLLDGEPVQVKTADAVQPAAPGTPAPASAHAPSMAAARGDAAAAGEAQ